MNPSLAQCCCRWDVLKLLQLQLSHTSGHQAGPHARVGANERAFEQTFYVAKNRVSLEVVPPVHIDDFGHKPFQVFPLLTPRQAALLEIRHLTRVPRILQVSRMTEHRSQSNGVRRVSIGTMGLSGALWIVTGAPSGNSGTLGCHTSTRIGRRQAQSMHAVSRSDR